jgi:uncharacterized membrane protein (DUF441 family)
MFLLGVGIRNSLLASAAGILLVLSFLQLQPALLLLEKRGVELGLLLLTLALLPPFASGKITPEDLKASLLSLPGLVAVTGGAVAAVLNSRGVQLLAICPEIATSVIVGSIASILLFGGILVGPVMAAGVTAVFLSSLSLIQ